jgi:hypothetical protein
MAQMALTLNPSPRRERDFESGSPSPPLGEGVGGVDAIAASRRVDREV